MAKLDINEIGEAVGLRLATADVLLKDAVKHYTKCKTLTDIFITATDRRAAAAARGVYIEALIHDTIARDADHQLKKAVARTFDRCSIDGSLVTTKTTERKLRGQ